MVSERLAGAVVGIAVLVMANFAHASAEDVFAELTSLPKPPDRPLDLSGPPRAEPAGKSVLIVNRDGSEEMTVIGNRGPDWASLRQIDIAEHKRLVEKFGPVVQNYSQAFNSRFSVKVYGIELSAAGIWIGPIGIGFGGPRPKD